MSHFIMRFCLLLLSMQLTLFAGETRLDINKLIFGNGGGFQDKLDWIELVSITSDGSYISKPLDLGSSDYIEREPDRVSQFPHIIPDYIYLDPDIFAEAGTTDKTYDLGQASTYSKGTLSGQINTLLVGDIARHFLSFRGDVIDAWTILPGVFDESAENTFKEGKLVMQDDEFVPGDLIMSRYNDGTSDKPILVYRGSVLKPDGSTETRLSIKEDTPPEVLYINGSIKVGDGFQLNGAAGIFANEPSINGDGTWTYNSWMKIAEKSIEIKYVSHELIVMATATFQTGSAGGTAMRIVARDADGGYVTDVDSGARFLQLDNSNNPSDIRFDGSYAQEFYNLGTSWSGTLNPSSADASIPRRYTFQVYIKDYDYGRSRVPSGRLNDLVIIGLPSSSPPASIANGDISRGVLENINSSIISPDPGNYLEKNKVVFQNGGSILDGESATVLKYPGGFKKFKATKINARNIYRLSVLEILGDYSAQSSITSKYSLFLGGEWYDPYLTANPSKTDDEIMGFTVSGLGNPMTYDDDNVTYNIQSWSMPSPNYEPAAGNETTLYIHSPLTVGRGNGLNVNYPAQGNGTNLTAVAVNMPMPVASPQNANTRLFVNGNLAFTGQYLGKYGRIYQEIASDASSISQTMTGFTPGTWNFIVIGNANMHYDGGASNQVHSIKTTLTPPSGSTFKKNSGNSEFSFDNYANRHYGFVSMYSEEISIQYSTDIVKAGVEASRTCKEVSVVILAIPKEIRID